MGILPFHAILPQIRIKVKQGENRQLKPDFAKWQLTEFVM